ncbi:MAG TPA: hypothetical protein VMZ30_08485 [Pyrinomonadaceae bacterium]|nr:hypothetical protein [Pyrinomonadaceae bacterium]
METEFESAVTARQQAAENLVKARRTGVTNTERVQAADLFRQKDSDVNKVRSRALKLVQSDDGNANYTDVNYVFPTFITTVLPIGLVGLWIVTIITAATDSIAAELNSLATATVIDFYRRHYRPAADDSHYLTVARAATAGWGLFACIVAVYASTLGSLIEVVNRFGSFFYGSILGVFALALLTRRATGIGAFVGLLAGMLAVAFVAYSRPEISFLWHNVVGASAVVSVGLITSVALPKHRRVA